MTELRQIAVFHAPFGSKFGVPRQAGLSDAIRGEIQFLPEFRRAEALRGLEKFSYIWLLWEFSGNRKQSADGEWQATVRPPRLGGNRSMGVFATRSPYRPNPIGLSSVRIDYIDWDNLVIHTIGADLMDGTPIYDIKPYLEYADSHPGAGNGFVDDSQWHNLHVNIGQSAMNLLKGEYGFADADIEGLTDVLSLDPRPHYQDDPDKVYGFLYLGKDIHFTVKGDELTVLDC